MEILRKKSVSTRMLILLEIVVNRKGSMRQIAEGVGITPQAVWDYLRKMEEEGTVVMKGTLPTATVKGVDLLHRNLLSLKGFVDRSVSRLAIVASTDAIAAGPISKGDTVSLVMRDGLLLAVMGDDGPSVGTAQNACRKWDMVTVSDLRGVMEMEKGHLLLMEMLPARSGGGTMRVRGGSMIEEFQSFVQQKGGVEPRFAACDLEAVALVERSGIKGYIELPNWEMVRDHLDRGVDIIAMGTPHTIASYLSHLEEGGGGILWRRSRIPALDPEQER